MTNNFEFRELGRGGQFAGQSPGPATPAATLRGDADVNTPPPGGTNLHAVRLLGFHSAGRGCVLRLLTQGC
ncbi:MAG: hypothetical protein ACKOGA_09835 [Planctomycetaceae bacterium]